jgi:hypothetical protein
MRNCKCAQVIQIVNVILFACAWVTALFFPKQLDCNNAGIIIGGMLLLGEFALGLTLGLNWESMAIHFGVFGGSLVALATTCFLLALQVCQESYFFFTCFFVQVIFNLVASIGKPESYIVTP